MLVEVVAALEESNSSSEAVEALAMDPTRTIQRRAAASERQPILPLAGVEAIII